MYITSNSYVLYQTMWFLMTLNDLEGRFSC